MLVDDSVIFFFSSRRRHTRLQGDWSSDVCSSDLGWRYWYYGADYKLVDQLAYLNQLPKVKEDHRSEEHTSELQSPCNLVCRLLLGKKKKQKIAIYQCSEHHAL